MYMAFIDGYDQVMAFHSNKAVAKRLAVARKKNYAVMILRFGHGKTAKIILEQMFI